MSTFPMIIAALDPLVALGTVATAFGSVAGGYALLKSRKVESKSANREETQQALDAQSKLLDRYEARIAHLEKENERLRKDLRGYRERMDQVLAKAEDAEINNQACQSRLRLAEARILELGG